jgi:predicted HAD superfamily Cof-like phosphohydrolase
MSKDWVADITAMHDKFGVNNKVREFDRTKLLAFLEFRIKFLAEELREASDAYDLLRTIHSGDHSPDTQRARVDAADDIVDACIDLCVVAIGTLNALDVDPYVAWDRVHEKNMQKEVGIKASRPNPLGLPDLIKPEGWTAPSHADNIGLLSKI